MTQASTVPVDAIGNLEAEPGSLLGKRLLSVKRRCCDTQDDNRVLHIVINELCTRNV